jgi:hypothetical protein
VASGPSRADTPAHDAGPTTVLRTGVGAADEYAGLDGPLDTSVILALQRLAGNRATAGMLQPHGLQREVETPGGWFGKNNILGDWRNELLLRMAADFIDNPVHKKCVYHYGRAKGAPLKLDRTDMKAMNIQFNVLGWKPVATAIKEAEADLRSRFKDPEREQAGFAPIIPAGAEAERWVSAHGTAIANGSVAGCTAHIEGKVIVSKGGARFEGTVRITDRWDFDPAWLSKEDKSHRTWIGEVETNVGWALLPGEPFQIETETVNVKQFPGIGRAQLEL